MDGNPEETRAPTSKWAVKSSPTARLAEVFQADRELEEAMFQEMLARVLHPRGQAHILWDLIVSAFILFNLIVTPLELALMPQGGGGTLALINAVSDAVFILDIAVSFRTAVPKIVRGREILVVESSLIAQHYINGALLLDVVSVGVPFGIASHISGLEPGAARLLRMLAFIKIVRVFKLNALLARLWQPRPRVAKMVSLVKLAFAIISISHVLGCVYYIFAVDAEGVPHQDSWITAFGHQDKSGLEAYLPGMYFVLMTLTTVGYGDISASTTGEMVFVSLLMLFGALIFSLISGMTINAVQALLEDNAELVALTGIMEDFVENYKLEEVDPGLGQALHETLEYQLAIAQSVETDAIIKSLPAPLSRRILRALHSPLLLRVGFLLECPDAFMTPLAKSMQLEVCLPGTTLINCGHRSQKFWLIREGHVKAYALVNTVAVADFLPGDYFGELNLILPDARTPFTLRAASASELYSLTFDDFDPLLSKFKNVRTAMLMDARARLNRQRRRMIVARRKLSEESQRKRESWGHSLVITVIQGAALLRNHRRRGSTLRRKSVPGTSRPSSVRRRVLTGPLPDERRWSTTAKGLTRPSRAKTSPGNPLKKKKKRGSLYKSIAALEVDVTDEPAPSEDAAADSAVAAALGDDDMLADAAVLAALPVNVVKIPDSQQKSAVTSEKKRPSFTDRVMVFGARVSAAAVSLEHMVLEPPETVDSFVSISIAGQDLAPSQVLYNTESPVWNASHVFDISAETSSRLNPYNEPLLLRVFQHDAFRGDYLIGEARLPWYRLYCEHNKKRTREEDLARTTRACEGWAELLEPHDEPHDSGTAGRSTFLAVSEGEQYHDYSGTCSTRVSQWKEQAELGLVNCRFILKPTTLMMNEQAAVIKSIVQRLGDSIPEYRKHRRLQAIMLVQTWFRRKAERRAKEKGGSEATDDTVPVREEQEMDDEQLKALVVARHAEVQVRQNDMERQLGLLQRTLARSMLEIERRLSSMAKTKSVADEGRSTNHFHPWDRKLR